MLLLHIPNISRKHRLANFATMYKIRISCSKSIPPPHRVRANTKSRFIMPFVILFAEAAVQAAGTAFGALVACKIFDMFNDDKKD